MSDCSNCHQPMAPGDNICENCGAVLSTITVTQARYVTAPSMPVLPSAPASLTNCPTCKALLKPDETICENCGMILSAKTSATLSRTTTPQGATGSMSVAALNECPRCHQPRKADSKFCNGCGLRYDSSASAQLANRQAAGALVASTSSLKVGDLLNNKYKITREIGEGGMGAVFLAEDQLLKRLITAENISTGNSNAAFSQFTNAVDQLAKANQDHYNQTFDSINGTLMTYFVLSLILFPLIGLLTLGGIVLRLKDF